MSVSGSSQRMMPVSVFESGACCGLSRDLPFEVVTSVLYIVDSSAADRVSFAEFVATIRAALCVLPISHRDR